MRLKLAELQSISSVTIFARGLTGSILDILPATRADLAYRSMLPLLGLCMLISTSMALRYPSHLSPRTFLSMQHDFDPFNLDKTTHPQTSLATRDLPQAFSFDTPLLLSCLLTSTLLLGSSAVFASTDLQQLFDPSQFQPVCPASDAVYQVLKVTANGIVGKENVDEYGPLIASVLLRIRLELCVLESFLYEAVIPFVSKKGLSWILPLHETVETFLAGTIFAIASNFILLGSTKILSVLFIYADVITGMPTRFLGDSLRRTNSQNSVMDRVGYVIKLYGDVIGTMKSVLESADTFVGRYLVIFTTFYITFKFLHFKVFNDIFP